MHRTAHRATVDLGQLYTVCLLPVLGQQIAGGDDLLRLGTVADQCDARTGARLQQVKALACAGQRSQRGVLLPAGIADRAGAGGPPATR